MCDIAHVNRPRCDCVFACEPGRGRRARSRADETRGPPVGRPTVMPIGELRYACGGRFPAIAARAHSFIRLVPARFMLKYRAELAGYIRVLRIEGTEAVSD
ncbi:hypothetical protein DPMN_127665 [Dreissena polymorpha]|uniref:Uncharacterized protein n=1 Tax=Dreissena polymorpha TaxID=45954 RepID=A0A9D4JV19_DREPO|nr:hypothetical protein DPMN_127665 [Dreissena polymorpha]